MIFSKNKDVEKTQKEFYFILEKLVNIALAKTKRNDNQSVIEILDNLDTVFEKFWQLKKKNPQKFESLLWSYDFFKDYIQPIENHKKLDSGDSQEEDNISDLKRDAYYRLTFHAERELRGITLFIGSYEKVWQCAFQYNNDELSRYAVYHLVWMLDKLIHEPSNNLVVEQFLKIINSIAFQATKVLNSDLNNSIYTASIYWYFDIIFDKFSLKENKFDLSYLEAFDMSFFNSLKNIISKNQELLFNVFISHLHDGVPVFSYSNGEIWKYINLGFQFQIQEFHEYQKTHELDKKAMYLDDLENELYTKKNLESYLKELDELTATLNSIFTEEQKEEAQKINDEIKDFAISKFKLNNLLGITFDISSYCIFKEKIDYIKCLWEYKQPFDADASYAGHDILPNTMKELFYLYFNRREKDYPFEDHHGSTLYQTQYMLALLTRLYVHNNLDLKIKANSSTNISTLEQEYMLINKFLSYSDLFLETCEMLINQSGKWDDLLHLEQKNVDEYQPEYDKQLTKINAKKQFGMTKKWLINKKLELKNTLEQIEDYLPIDSENKKDCETKISDGYTTNNTMSKVVSIKEIDSIEANSLNFNVTNCYHEKIPMNCFIKVSNSDCFLLWSNLGRRLNIEELKNFIKLISNCNDIIKLDVNHSENIINIYDSIESSINSLISNGSKPSTIIMPHKLLNQFLKEQRDSKLKFYKKFTRFNFMFNNSINLEIINNPCGLKADIIILDNTACIWKFKPTKEKGEKVHIEINRDKAKPKLIDLSVKTIVNFEMVNKNAINILRISKDN